MGQPAEKPQETLKSTTTENFNEAAREFEKEMHGKKPEGRNDELKKEEKEEEQIAKLAEKVKEKLEEQDKEKLESTTTKTFLGDSFDILSNLFTRAGWFQLIILFTIAFMQITGMGVVATATIMLTLGAICNYVKRALEGDSWDPLQQLGVYDAVKGKKEATA